MFATKKGTQPGEVRSQLAWYGSQRFAAKKQRIAMRNFGAFAGMLALIGAASIFDVGQAVAQQSFSCPYGTNASCLDYGDKVCSSSAKCISQDSVCFDSYTCNYQGFICKSKYDDVVDEHDDLLRKNRSLVSDYNELLRRNKTLISEYNSLLDEHQQNVDDYNGLLSEHSALESCVSFADSLEAAKICAW